MVIIMLMMLDDDRVINMINQIELKSPRRGIKTIGFHKDINMGIKFRYWALEIDIIRDHERNKNRDIIIYID